MPQSKTLYTNQIVKWILLTGYSDLNRKRISSPGMMMFKGFRRENLNLGLKNSFFLTSGPLSAL